MESNNPFRVGTHTYESATSRAAGVAAMRRAGELPPVEYVSPDEAIEKAGLK